jgi:hypothetical protein
MAGHSGLCQATVSRLVAGLRKAGIIEVVEPQRRYHKRYGLSADGQKRLAGLEEALNKTPLANASQQTSAGQPKQRAVSGKPTAQDPTPVLKRESGTTGIYSAMAKRFPDRVKRYEERRLKPKIRR